MKPAISPSRTLALPLLLAIGLTLAARSAGPALYVSNEVANTLSVISPQTNSVVATIAVGKRPRGLAASPDRRTVYVALGQDDAHDPRGPRPRARGAQSRRHGCIRVERRDRARFRDRPRHWEDPVLDPGGRRARGRRVESRWEEVVCHRGDEQHGFGRGYQDRTGAAHASCW